MTSPNTVTILVKATDQSAPGFASAAAGAGKLAKAVDGGAGSAGASLESAEKKARGLGSVLGNVGTIAGGILAADVISQGAQRVMALSKQTITAASSLGESLNAVDKTFGASAKNIHAWAENNAASFGLSQRAFNESATPLGAMLKNQGLSMAEVEKQTIKLTKRAADMGSVFNVDVSQALIAIQAGLRGESDPLERFGVGLSAAAVEAKALADTGKESAMALTQQEKALARLNLIYEQTATTEGDFQETVDGLANAQRKATAEFENAQAKIGAIFLPVAAKAAQVSGQFAETVGDIPGPVAAVGAAVLIAGAGMLVFAPRVIATKEALDQMAESQSAVTRTAGRLAVWVGKVGAALAVLQIGGALVGSMLDNDLNPQIEAAVKGLSEWDRASKLSGEAARLFGDDAEGLGDAMQQLAVSGFFEGINSVDNWAAHIMGMTGPVDEATDKVGAFDTALAQMVRNGQGDQALLLLAVAAEKAGISIDDVRKILPQYSGAVEVAAKSTGGMAKVAEEAAKSLDELEKQFDETFQKAFGFEESQDAAADAVARLNKQIEQQIEDEVEGAGTLDRNTQAGRDNAEAVRDLVRRYEDLMVQAQKTGQSTDGMREDLVNQIEAMGISRAEAERYVRILVDVKNALDAIPKHTTIQIDAVLSGNVPRGYVNDAYASGGIVSAAATGGPRSNRVLVGEHGPEIADLPPGTMVHSNPDSMAMMGGGGGRLEVVISLDPSIGGRDRDLVESLCKMLRYKVRIDGSEVIGIPST
jgi:hypothetical protein